MKCKYKINTNKINFLPKIVALTSVLLLFTTMPANAFGHDEKEVLNLTNVKVIDAIKAIEKTTNYKFVFNNNDIDLKRIISVSTDNKNIETIIKEIFSEYDVFFRENTVLVKTRKLNTNKVTQQRSRIVKGEIIDSSTNEPIIGASVWIKNSTQGAVSDINGFFSLSVSGTSTVLVISYLGYQNKEIEVVDKTDLGIITLDPTEETLEEVVVVGFGMQKKASVVGAIQNINPAELHISSNNTISNSLAGKLAGVIAVTRSGEPGYNQSNFWIRGISSFSGNTNPLVLVDGVQRSLDDLDISEIETFSILKDAATSAMYGVRGANGVIIINTKRGKVQKPIVNLQIEHSITAPTQLPNYIGAADHMQLLNDLAKEEGKVPYYEEQAIINTRNNYDPELYADVNWVDIISKDQAYNTRINMNVNGGTEMLRYNLTGAIYSEDGIMERDETLTYDTSTGLTRYNLRANVDLDLTSTTSMRFSAGGFLQKLRKHGNPTNTTWSWAFATPPMVHPAIYADGKIPKRAQQYNPWAFLTQYGYNVITSSKIESLFALEQKLDFLSKGLSTKLTFSFDNYSSSTLSRTKSPSYYLPATSRDDEGELNLTLSEQGSEFLNYKNSASYGNNQTYLEWIINYDRTFDKIHNVNGLLLYNQRSYDDGGIQPYRNQGMAGRISYSYRNKYVGEFNFGYNGSENFAKGNRFGFFPSVAAGWIVSEEEFWDPLRNHIDFLKLRVSWGKAGNDQIGSNRRFAYITTMNSENSGYYWGTTGNYYRQGVSEGEVGVSNLTWETVTKKNIGIEFGLWNSLRIQADLFNELREDIFMKRNSIPSQSGFLSTPYANYGKVKNRGGELAMTFNKQFGKVGLSLMTNITYAKNTILEYDVPKGQQGNHQDITGHSVNELYGYQALRLYAQEDFNDDGTLVSSLPNNELAEVRPGDIMFLDWNNDGVINSQDQGYVGGTKDPRWVYGFGGGLRAYGFDFNFFFQGIGDTYRFVGDGNTYFIPGSGQGINGNIFENYTDRWSVENPAQDVFWPRLSYSINYNNNANSTWWKKDMSFLRLKQLELGYTFTRVLSKQINNLRLYISGTNLLTFSKFKLWDPEIDTSTGSAYPPMKSVMVGLDITF